MKRIIVLITMIFMFISSVAFAGGKIQKKGNDTYFELSGRYSNSESLNLSKNPGYDSNLKRNNGFGLAGEIGKKFGKNFRMGAEFAYRQARLSGQVRNNNNFLDGSIKINDHEKPGIDDHGKTTVDDHEKPDVADHADTTVDEHDRTTIADHTDTTVADHDNTAVAEHRGTTVADHAHNSLDDHVINGGARQIRSYEYTTDGETYLVTEYRGGGVTPTAVTTVQTFSGNNPNDVVPANQIAALKSATPWKDWIRTERYTSDTGVDVNRGETYVNSNGISKPCPRDTCSVYQRVTEVTSYTGTTDRNHHNGLDDHEHIVNTDGVHRVSTDVDHEVITDGVHNVNSDGTHTVTTDKGHVITFDGSHSVSEDLDHVVTFDGMHSINFGDFMENKDVDFGSRYLTTKSIMLNAYYDFDSAGGVTPWVGVGVGTTWSNLADSAAFSYQLMAGMDMAITDTTSLVLGYNWFQTDDIEMETRDIRGTVTDWKAQVGGHEVKLGVKFWF